MSNKDKIIYVTGSAGFIGQHLIKRLKELEYTTVGIDRREEGEQKADKFVHKDINDINWIKDYKGHAMVHLAAEVSVQKSMEDPVGTHANNLTTTLKTLEDCKRAGIGRYVFASSAAVYGDKGNRHMLEHTLPEPISPYGLQKLASEHYCRIYGQAQGMSTISLRLFNVYGHGQNPEYAGVIRKFMDNQRQGEPYTIFGDGYQTRCFVYVGDVIEAIVKAIENNERGEFNIADPEEISLFGIISMLGSGQVDRKDEKPGDIRYVKTSITKAKRLLEWEPKTRLEDWLKDNKSVL